MRVTRAKPWEIGDRLWAVIEPLLPKVEGRSRHAGRKRHPARLVFQGILFVLHTGSPGNTCRRDAASARPGTAWTWSSA